MIALSYKEIPNAKDEDIVNFDRDKVEINLKFLGLLIFVNKIKEATYKAIEDLKYAGIKSVMATGDHGLTAISVAKKCKILDANKPVYFGELASSGDKKYVRWELMRHHENSSKDEQNDQ